MKDEERLPEGVDHIEETVFPQVVEQLLPDAERAPTDRHFRLTRRGDPVHRWPQQAGDVRWVGRGVDGRHRDGLRDPRCRGQHGGSSKAVADEQLRRLPRLAQKRGRRGEVLDVRREVAVREFAFAVARPVKSKRSTAMPRSASVRLMRVAANPALEHVKQCAKRAYASGVPAG